eukprot:6353646-Pyramimonas_sp.AAC.1
MLRTKPALSQERLGVPQWKNWSILRSQAANIGWRNFDQTRVQRLARMMGRTPPGGGFGWKTTSSIRSEQRVGCLSQTMSRKA